MPGVVHFGTPSFTVYPMYAIGCKASSACNRIVASWVCVPAVNLKLLCLGPLEDSLSNLLLENASTMINATSSRFHQAITHAWILVVDKQIARVKEASLCVGLVQPGMALVWHRTTMKVMLEWP